MQKTFISILLTLFSFGFVSAQSITINTELDTNMILIGDQIKLKFEINQPKDLKLNFPELQDTIIKEIEIVEKSAIDTIVRNGNILLKQDWLITSFDTGVYLIPRLPFSFINPGDGQPDTIFSPSRYFGVNTFELDTTNAIFDIKMPVPAPVTIAEAAPWIGGGLVFVLVVLGIIYFLRLQSGKETITLKRPKPKEPAHLFAYRKLDELKNRKLWQQGKIKEYYSELTEILRMYLEFRYDIMSLEMTTDETMEALNNAVSIDSATREMLYNILSLADFVKFAKMNPLPDENDKCLKNGYIFIDKTKPVIQLDDKVDQENEEKEVEQKQLNS
jgi:hypothetical protein